MTVLQFPVRQGPRQDGRRLAREPLCPIFRLQPKQDTAEAWRLYVEAEACDTLQPRKAIQLYQRAIALNPQLHLAYTNLGNVHFRLGDTPGAERLYRAALAVDKRQPQALYNLGFLALESGRYVDAKDLFERALISDPDFSDAHYNHAIACDKLGFSVSAVVSYERYLEVAPPDDAWRAKAEARVAQKL